MPKIEVSQQGLQLKVFKKKFTESSNFKKCNKLKINF